jgi:hypothetical protein
MLKRFQEDLFTLLDRKAAAEAKKEAIERVQAHAPAEWLSLAERVVLTLAHSTETFTTDDVWRIIPKPPEPRALGAVLHRLAKRGVIARTGQYVSTAQESRHHAPIAVWRSCLPGAVGRMVAP